MMLRTAMDHLPWSIQRELRRISVILFEAFEETTKGRLSERYRAGRILKLILHGPHAECDWEEIGPGEAFHLMVIVNFPRLAHSERDWRPVRDRLNRAFASGEIVHPVRMSVESLEGINRQLVSGTPYFIAIAENGIALYQANESEFRAPSHLTATERAVRGLAEFTRRHGRGRDFLSGAVFFRNQGNAPMAALLLHQACEQFYQCALWSITFHGPRTHALDELREAAERLAHNLVQVWPRDLPFERRAFGCIRRAYVAVRYGRTYRITDDELEWALGRVEILQEQVRLLCMDYCAPRLSASIPALGEKRRDAPLPPSPRGVCLPQRQWQIARRPKRPRIRWNRLIPVHLSYRSAKSRPRFLTFLAASLCLALASIGVASEYASEYLRKGHITQSLRKVPADPSAVMEFDVQADTVLGAVGEIANRAGYRIKSNEDIWSVRWTGAYRAKATTFDALSDVLYGSGLCPAIRGDVITVRSCSDGTSPTIVTYVIGGEGR